MIKVMKYRIQTSAGVMKTSGGAEYIVTKKDFQDFHSFFFCGCGGAKFSNQADGTIKITNPITHQPVVLIPV